MHNSSAAPAVTVPQVEISLEHHSALIHNAQTVRRGERIAVSSRTGTGDIHSPVAGKVEHVDAYRVRIITDQQASEQEMVEPVALDSLSADSLFTALRELGADIMPLRTVHTLIINAVDAEKELVSRKGLLASQGATLLNGLTLAKRLYSPDTIIQAIDPDSTALEGIEAVPVTGPYPAGLDPLVAFAVTGQEAPADTLVLALETLYQLGQIQETGLPVLQTMVTVNGTGQLVAVGTPVGKILADAGERIMDGDRILFGGIMCGRPVAGPDQGIERGTSAVQLLRTTGPLVTDAACVNCGECVRHCPARLDPAMISGYAEFRLFAKAEAAHVDACFECGLCGFHCIARRPMLQYIRLAKEELRLARKENQS